MALSSMTGFSRAAGSADGYSWTIELKSVNGRGLDLRFRLPSPFDLIEPEARARMQKALTRGNVQIGLSARRDASSGEGRVNDALFLSYAEAAERLAWSAKLAAPGVGDILRLPGVIEAADAGGDRLSEAAQAAVLGSFDEAIAGLVASRRSEGEALGRIVTGLIDDMADRVRAAEAADGARGAAIRERLKAQVEMLLGTSQSFDAQRLHQEAALIATRIDIREEIDRLKAHIEQARTLLASREAVGRKLDFLSQEFVRETNTLCSKANDIALTRIGLDLKAIVEQFREQVQNIE